MRLLLGSLVLMAGGSAWGHPEDEFCTADSGLDPALCAALAEADRSTDLDAARGPGGKLTEAQRERVRQDLVLDRPW